jgi:hypothetical protein
MKGDFSRFTYDNTKNYLGLIKQQGRASLDSDWNEQAAIWIDNFRQLTLDIMGRFAIPLTPNCLTDDNSNAFKIDEFRRIPGGGFDFSIGKGMAYIDGLPLRLFDDYSYRNQPDLPEPELVAGEGNILVYLKSWIHTINYIDDHSIRESALGGPDTCHRFKHVGQIKAILCGGIDEFEKAGTFLKKQFDNSKITMTMKIDHSAEQIPLGFGDVDLGIGNIPGNLHMRVELHRGSSNNGDIEEGIKWSDDNCSTVVPVLKSLGSNTLLVEESEQVSGVSLDKGDWVEIANFSTEFNGMGSQVTRIRNMDSKDNGLAIAMDSEIHPLLRRLSIGKKSGTKFNLKPRLRKWTGFITPANLNKTHNLSKGIRIAFQIPGKKSKFTPGAYWLFALRDREYNKKFAPLNALPQGQDFNYVPLAIIPRRGTQKSGPLIDCRKFYKP